MSTKYGHIELFSNPPITLVCGVCLSTFNPLPVRSHLRTKSHQKNALEFAHQKMLKESADQTIYKFKTSQTPRSSLREYQRSRSSIDYFAFFFSGISELLINRWVKSRKGFFIIICSIYFEVECVLIHIIDFLGLANCRILRFSSPPPGGEEWH